MRLDRAGFRLPLLKKGILETNDYYILLTIIVCSIAYVIEKETYFGHNTISN